ncbi:MAG: glycosyltransferase family protein [Saccharofermentanales bacterium]
MMIFEKMIGMLDIIVQKKRIFILSFIYMITAFIISFLYFKGIVIKDRISWIFWVISISLLMISVYKKSGSKKTKIFDGEKSKLFLLIIGIAIIYFVTHFWNYGIAPWNSNGLFDDAAWDIYFVQEYTTGQAPVQIIFNDSEIGRISRELVFHYYIGAWFNIFGYNLLIFNIALIFLGFITVLFTSLLILLIFRRYLYAIAAAALMNFFPMYYTQIFIGHRYAICVPLMMISIYYIYYGFRKKSIFGTCLGGVFAALCMESAIMGKQYIYALAATGIFYILFTLKDKNKIKDSIPLMIAFTTAFLFTMIPLLTYMLTNHSVYNVRESNLIKEFFARVQKDGFAPIWENICICFKTIFSGFTYQRQFMNAFPIIPYLYLPFIILGMIIAFLKKHYYILFMIAIPLAGNIVAISFDFRLLISAPFYIISVVFAFHWLVSYLADKKMQAAAVFIGSAILLVSPVQYLYSLSMNTNGQYYMPHKSVAASRLIQDIVVGDKSPDTEMKWNEFRRENNNSQYDTLAATRYSYAHVHAFLNDYDAFKILSLTNNFPYDGVEPVLLKGYFAKAISDFKYNDKDLMLVIEKGPEMAEILRILKKFDKKEIKEYSKNVDGAVIQMFTMRIADSDFKVFKDYISNELGVE